MANGGLPAGVGIEQVWLMEATYVPDAAEARVPFRAEHLARIARLSREGVIIEAGACVDVSTSVVLLRAGSEEEARRIVAEDPYVREGIRVEVRVKPFGRVVFDEAEAG